MTFSVLPHPGLEFPVSNQITVLLVLHWLGSCEQSIITWHQSLRWSPAFRRRRALAITDTELRLMAALAIMGLRRMPVNG